MADPVLRLRAPSDLNGHALQRLGLIKGGSVVLEVSSDYEKLSEAFAPAGEVFAIQHLLSLARRAVPLEVHWDRAIVSKMPESAPIYPLLACVLMLQGAQHRSSDLSDVALAALVASSQKKVLQHRAMADLFSSSQILLCADSRGFGRIPDLYERATGRLRSREDFQTLVFDLLASQLTGAVASANSSKFAALLAVIFAELVENTDVHGRLDGTGVPVGPDAMRGVAIKTIALSLGEYRRRTVLYPARTLECLEISVFDTGLGYFSSYTKQALLASVDISFEWKVFHNCLARHFYPEVADGRSAHRAMGLNEVLRAIQDLRGRIEFRTGRLFAYRTFLEGELQVQMESPESPLAQRHWPRPKLLDVDKRLTSIPTEHEAVVGSAVRILVPLA